MAILDHDAVLIESAPRLLFRKHLDGCKAATTDSARMALADGVPRIARAASLIAIDCVR